MHNHGMNPDGVGAAHIARGTDPRGWTDAKLRRLSEFAHELLSGDAEPLGLGVDAERLAQTIDGVQRAVQRIDAEITRRGHEIDAQDRLDAVVCCARCGRCAAYLVQAARDARRQSDSPDDDVPRGGEPT